ncbi:hypothetical protein PV327_008141 [Microctonus hyperodae]|uniref:Uncharacterized protein n=1 Tax=Microctonus hyperodae TaxID=165561 RepID=A0AA39KGM0_MICHY|nr:hypothetical protein PV327_008141 [Microctonus hyperodae]
MSQIFWADSGNIEMARISPTKRYIYVEILARLSGHYLCTITWHGFRESIPDSIHDKSNNFLVSPDSRDTKTLIDKEKISVDKTFFDAYSPVIPRAIRITHMMKLMNEEATELLQAAGD